MKPKPIELGRQITTSAKHYFFVDKGRAVLTEPIALKSLPGRYGFQVRDFLILPSESADLPKDQYVTFRDLLDTVSAKDADAIAGGASLTNWDFMTQKCGVCGDALKFKNDELGKSCPSCRQTFYPQIQPVAIVLVRKGKDLLLARGLPPRKHHSCLAGFVEVGETVETTAKREVFEEVGIEIENLKYFSSQSWPFPSNLMLGYIADYKSGEIRIDTTEISHAAWFTKENPPEVLPPKISIARQMIDSIWGK